MNLEKEKKIAEEIKELGYEIDKRIRKNSNTEAEFARKTGRHKATLNSLLRSLRDGKSCNLTGIFSILIDLDLKLTISESEK